MNCPRLSLSLTAQKKFYSNLIPSDWQNYKERVFFNVKFILFSSINANKNLKSVILQKNFFQTTFKKNWENIAKFVMSYDENF